jgi:hypothetical protein
MSIAERIAWGAWGLLSFIALIGWLRWVGPLKDQRKVTPSKKRKRQAPNDWINPSARRGPRLISETLPSRSEKYSVPASQQTYH